MRAYTQPPSNYARSIISLFVGIRGSHWDSCQKEPFVFYKDKLQILRRQGARRNVVIQTTFFLCFVRRIEVYGKSSRDTPSQYSPSRGAVHQRGLKLEVHGRHFVFHWQIYSSSSTWIIYQRRRCIGSFRRGHDRKVSNT